MKATLYHLLPILFLSAIASTVRSQVDTTKADTGAVYPQKEIVVTGERPKEEQAVGPYKQPEWTLHRRFPSTRVYIQTMPGEVEFEQWVEIRVPPRNSGEKSLARFAEELEFGLGKRTQLDIYLNTLRQWDGAGSSFGLRGWSVEMRWAFADWGVLPGNPTLYLEYSVFDSANGDEGKGYDKIEPKLLLGGELAARWHWGLNLVTERGLAPFENRDEEYNATGVISYSLADQSLSIGPSFSYTHEIDRNGGIATTTNEILAGPSLQWRPSRKAHLDLEPLFGLTDESKQLKMFVVFGWDL
ncbi:MAG: hypothetical protein ABSF91_05745 [Bacteroidota bacterium]|jgi:hypothetical protein